MYRQILVLVGNLYESYVIILFLNANEVFLLFGAVGSVIISEDNPDFLKTIFSD
jgi:hypothetical protein